jgi:hypothetical protein
MDKILVLGDSHTYGSGFDDASFNEPWKDHSSKTWVYHMFDKDKITNKSYPGCSNDAMTLKLIRHATKNDLVLIMFTYPERIHMTKDGCNFNVSPAFFSNLAEDVKESTVATQLRKRYEDEYKNIIPKYFDDNMLELLFLKNILLCQTFCESKNIDYYFTMVDFRPKVRCTGGLAEYRDSLYQSINWNKIFLINKHGFSNYGKLINAGKGLDNEHWGENLHKTFGEFFSKFIEEDRKKKESIV